ncbi:bacillithiol biosynthesis deacetylase BshB1 [Bacillus solimangrovi]|uniref:Bacillithiol biosynthesis deacetylase BshB1 n=2 Tax=Bacillus solimangrovi TaxID=1305675 RepID=A0A1E5LHS9_9BACI|nr:bacillithiol biosynthesis deacetylase BshB1 [Bacillus solimangrovi]
MGGTIAKYVRNGYKVGICDLTEANLSSNGTVEIRSDEAEKAGKLLGIQERRNLRMSDRGLLLTEEKISQVVEIIRETQPTIVFAPYADDRHPDHGNCARIVDEAIFSSGIRKYMPDVIPHRVERLYYYMINGFHKPDFVVDITDTITVKLDALRCYQSQFMRLADEVVTPLNNGYIETVEARERLFGKEVGVQYAEGFKANQPLLVDKDLLNRSY